MVASNSRKTKKVQQFYTDRVVLQILCCIYVFFKQSNVQQRDNNPIFITSYIPFVNLVLCCYFTKIFLVFYVYEDCYVV